MKLTCYCCGQPQTRKEAAVSILCPACEAARCAPWYRPDCAVWAGVVAERGAPIGAMFACGAGGCDVTYYFEEAPRLQLVGRDE